MKPLTADEITELRRALGFDDLSARYYIDAAVPRLLDEVERTRALLRRIEFEGSGHPKNGKGGCPECHGIYDCRHEPDCELAALLGGEG